MTQLTGVEDETIKESSAAAVLSLTQSLAQTAQLNTPKFPELMEAVSETDSDVEMPPATRSSRSHAPASSALTEVVSEVDSETGKQIQPIGSLDALLDVETVLQTNSAPSSAHEQNSSIFSGPKKKKKGKSNKPDGQT